jgi:AcrR family transcriptional regulator
VSVYSLTSKKRAKRLSPDERRESIIAVAIPLLSQKGDSLVVSEVAEAAGVAEATVFKVFPSRDSLIQSIIQSVIDTAELQAQLQQDRDRLPRDESSELADILEILRSYFVSALAAMRSIGSPKSRSLTVGTRQLLEPADSMVREEFALRFSSPDRAWMKRTFEMIFVSTIYSAATRELAGLDTPTTSELIQTLLHGAIMRPAGIEDQS